MESGSVTTPFGRRPMSIAMLASQFASQNIDPGRSVDKWKVYRLLCEARPLLGITDRALALLNALLSFYPKSELTEKSGLVVFPSNAQLSLRGHGMPEQTIRRHISVLIKAGLFIRKDSPNGKRYPYKDRAGGINDAFGFSLAPLLARFDEIERMAGQVVAERLHLQRLKERLTICRRDIHKLVDAALMESIEGDWQAIIEHLTALTRTIPRVATKADLEMVLGELEPLREDVINQLEMQAKIKKISANPLQNERHIQNSDSESSSESEPPFESVPDPAAADLVVVSVNPTSARLVMEHSHTIPTRLVETLKSFPLELVLQAAPQIIDYAPNGRISSWRDLMSAAVVIRTMLGVSPTAYRDACVVMGQENTATVMACILERAGEIKSPGGYLRDLTHRALKREFALGPMLMALLRLNGHARRLAG